jgi:ketosteroid isomerase-like protein
MSANVDLVRSIYGAHLFQVRGGRVTRLVQYLDGEREVTFVFSVRSGKIVRLQMFGFEQQALEALGLAE